MTGPSADGSIVMEIETGEPERYLQFEPDGLAGDRWLHRTAEFDESLTRSDLVEYYALPESEPYEVRLVAVSPGESLRIGDVAAMHRRSGGGDLVEVIDHGEIPSTCIVETRRHSSFR